MTARPNILLIVIDQFRADLLEGRLAEVADLTNLADLAARCCTFARHFSVATPCGPSRVSLLTGQYAMNHRAVRNGTPLRHDTPNLAQALRDAGYDPLLFGYTDTTLDPRALSPDDPRLTTYEEVMPGFTEVVRMRQETDDSVWRRHLADRGYDVPEGDDLYIPQGDGPRAPALYRAEDSDTAFLTDRFLDHMADAAPGWCAMLTYIRPHPPLVAPHPYNQRVDPAAIPAPAQGDPTAPPHPFLDALRRARPPGVMVAGDLGQRDGDAVTADLRAIYLGLAAEVDHHVGRVVAWLQSSGHWDDTILVLTADHGEMLGDHGTWGKGTYHDAAYHVPLMIRAPGGAARRVERMTESIDVAPTILDLAGVAVPATMDGESLRGAIETGAGGRDATFSEHDFGDPVAPTAIQRHLGLPAESANLAVLRTDTHRLVAFGADLPQVLFDMTDEGEARDVSTRSGAEHTCLDLSRRMLRHRMTHVDGLFARTMVTPEGVRTAPRDIALQEKTGRMHPDAAKLAEQRPRTAETCPATPDPAGGQG